MADKDRGPFYTTTEAEFSTTVAAVARELKGHRDLPKLAEIELQRSIVEVARFLRARERLRTLGSDHPDAEKAAAEAKAANSASTNSFARLYAISTLLPKDRAKAYLRRYLVAAQAM